jgi:hypothetical protein
VGGWAGARVWRGRRQLGDERYGTEPDAGRCGTSGRTTNYRSGGWSGRYMRDVLTIEVAFIDSLVLVCFWSLSKFCSVVSRAIRAYRNDS